MSLSERFISVKNSIPQSVELVVVSKKQSVEKVKAAVREFTLYVKNNEPGTLLYLAWQKKDDPTSFMHFSFLQMRTHRISIVNRKP